MSIKNKALCRVGLDNYKNENRKSGILTEVWEV